MENMMVRNMIHKALLIAATLLFASTASFADNVVVCWEGDGSVDNPYLIKTAEDLAGIAYYTGKGVSFGNTFFKLVNDIDLSEYDNWTPIGNGATGAKFMGVFDGADHTIDYLTISKSWHKEVGLFGYVDDATIKNLTIGSNSSVLAASDVAAVVGAADDCIISNVHNKADVTGEVATAGGILGHAKGKAILTNCTNSGTIQSLLHDDAFTHVGGIVGFCQNGVISNCTNNGPVISDKGEFTGGIIGCGAGNPGAISMEIIACTNNGSVTSASKAVGGIAGGVGYMPNPNELQITVKMCTNTGTVKSTAGEYMGGIVGAVNHYNTTVQNCENGGKILSENTVSSIGGIIGYSNYGYISDCVNNASVTANGGPSCKCESVGGIVGMITGMEFFDSSVKNCLNKGDVTTEGPYTGGIVGLYLGGQTDAQPHYIHLKLVENCTNRGKITNDNGNVGGIMGHGPAIVNKCKNEADITGNQSHVGGIVGTCGTIINCCNTGNITCNSSGNQYDDAGGLLGFNWTEVYGQDLFIANSYSRGDIKTAGSINFVGTVAASGYTAIYNCYGSGRVQFSGGESKYVVGACYYDTDTWRFPQHTFIKEGVFGGPGSMSDILYNTGAAGFANYTLNTDGEPIYYDNVESNYKTVLSFLKNCQEVPRKEFKIGDPSSPVITIETVAWKKGDDGYPAFATEPGYKEPAVPTYKVSYNLNEGGASGFSAPSQQTDSKSYTVSDIVSGGVYSYMSGNAKYTFLGWNTESDGTGDNYVAGSKISPMGDTTLYGIWAEGFQVRYALVEGLSAGDFASLALPFDTEWHSIGEEVTVKDAPTEFSPKEFVFWSMESDGSGVRLGASYESKFTVTGDMVIYANAHDITKQKIVIERTGLKAGESAVYTVTGPVVSYVAALEGKEESGAPVKVSTTIVNVPETGDYIVTETGWNWTYEKSEASVAPESQKVGVGKGTATAKMDANRTLIITFGGDVKEEEMPKHGENAKKEQ